MEELNFGKYLTVSFPRYDNLHYSFTGPFGNQIYLSLPSMYMKFLIYSGFGFSSYLLLKGTFSVFKSLYNYLKSKLFSPRYLEPKMPKD